MRELTNDLPKPMIAVRGKPILRHIVEGLAGRLPTAVRTTAGLSGSRGGCPTCRGARNL